MTDRVPSDQALDPSPPLPFALVGRRPGATQAAERATTASVMRDVFREYVGERYFEQQFSVIISEIQNETSWITSSSFCFYPELRQHLERFSVFGREINEDDRALVRSLSRW